MPPGAAKGIDSLERPGLWGGIVWYRNPQRSSGSQSEVPRYTVASDGTIRVRAYQRFDLHAGRITAVLSYKKKFDWINERLWLLRNTTLARTFMDVGCNAGLTSLLAQAQGYTEVTSLDHDTEYVDMLKKIAVQDNVETVLRPQQFTFGSQFPTKADVVFVGALIHWVFTCTADFGRFDLIMDYLLTAVSQVLLIEWVDPGDPAMKVFNHTDCGSAPQEPCGVAGFERELRRIGTISNWWPLPDRPTRVICQVDLS